MAEQHRIVGHLGDLQAKVDGLKALYPLEVDWGEAALREEGRLPPWAEQAPM